eukprot:gnl/TRDRNA2_/TRDRNA2_93436_c0_seq2.p1 gnl/TRDRNA2_/TRDRNA2_93436_c0~~gnl/TRDRNA2_/TRDRNA2_93436_c0_seq2.p1  ORF type:complete len:667 (-),score=51.84 gnl/TRDRNA2_/TRDRNA2_93436_c0_seq2:49-2049(-)
MPYVVSLVWLFILPAVALRIHSIWLPVDEQGTPRHPAPWVSKKHLHKHDKNVNKVTKNLWGSFSQPDEKVAVNSGWGSVVTGHDWSSEEGQEQIQQQEPATVHHRRRKHHIQQQDRATRERAQSQLHIQQQEPATRERTQGQEHIQQQESATHERAQSHQPKRNGTAEIRQQQHTPRGQLTKHNGTAHSPDQFPKRNNVTPWGSSSHCRLRAAFDALERNDATFAVVGGSATQGAGLRSAGRMNAFGFENPEDNWFGVAFQNNETWSTREGIISRRAFKNAAQGGTDSMWSALLLDSVVGDADILFWEYAIEDAKGGWTKRPRAGKEHLQESMELFIAMASGLPRNPALVFVYLWDADQDFSYEGFFSSALEYQEEVIKRFADAGLDVLVVPAAPAMRQARAGKDMRQHHPGGAGHQAIADLVLQEVYKAAMSAEKGCSQEEHRFITQSLAVKPSKSSAILEELYTMPSKSATAVEPRFGQNSVDTLACSLTGCVQPSVTSWGGMEFSRKDRKFSWFIPVCQAADGNLSKSGGHEMSNHLLVRGKNERGLKAKYMAMHVGGGSDHRNGWENRMTIKVNNLPSRVLEKPVSLIGNISLELMNDFNLWVDLETSDGSMTERPQVAICVPDSGGTEVWELDYSAHGGVGVDWVTVFYVNESSVSHPDRS